MVEPSRDPIGRAAFVTALGLEFAAVEKHLTDVGEETHPRGTVYRTGRFAGKVAWEVAVVESGPHNVAAAAETERLIAQFRPSVLLFAGIAGGLKDVALGDVVAATKIYAYEAGKEEVEFKPRPEIGESTYALVQRARSVRRESKWQSRIVDGPQPSLKAYVEPIAAGNKVVADIELPTYQLIRRLYSDALAVEMEGYGFLRAAYMNHGVQALVVRGISDLVANKGDADSSGSQPRAAAAAAAFAFEVLSQVELAGIVQTKKTQKSPDNAWFRRLEALAIHLYSHGPLDRQIWSRAGGEIALLEQASTGVAGWHLALRSLQQGGGGAEITPSTLIEAMQQDYGGNTELVELASENER